MARRSVTFGCVVALAMAGRAGAQPAPVQPPPVSLTLDEAVARAATSAPRLAEAQARVDAADAGIVSREAAGRPAATTSAAYQRTNHVIPFGFSSAAGGLTEVFPDVPDNYRVRGEITFPIYTGGRVEAAVEAARADARAAEGDRRAVAADVAFDVTRSYWTLTLARDRVRVLTEARARADAVVSDVRARVDTGVLPPNELQSAQVQRARQNVAVIQADNDVSAAEAELARLTGLPPGQRILTTTPVDRPAAAIGQSSTEALIARAREQRAERTSLVERASSFRAQATAARAGLRPQVAALASIEPTRPNPRFVPRADEWKTSWDVGVNVMWPIFDGGKARAGAAAAEAQAAAAEARLADFDAAVALDVRQRLLDIASTNAAIEASGEAVTAATEARRVLDERFAAGVATTTDVLDAQVALLEAQLERTRLLTSLRLSEARLIRTVGGG